MAQQPSIQLSQAASLALASHKRAVLTSYSLGILVFHLYIEGKIDGRPLRVKNPLPVRRHFNQVLEFFLSHGVLREVSGFTSGSVFSFIGRTDPSAHEVICAADPFAYLTHLSAMEIHGLTDRLPQMIFVSTPSPAQWRQHADERMHKDLGSQLADYVNAGFPRLLRLRAERILGHPLHVSQSSHLGAFKRLDEQGVRVSTIGRTFLDMLREPDLCGGIQHVLDVYRQHAKRYLNLIVGELDQHGTAIDKVRTGYILEEECGIDSEAVRAWATYAKRGGSRKLVATKPYSSTYSEKWCLSLNAD